MLNIKAFISIVLSMFVLLLTSGCNSDIFLDEDPTADGLYNSIAGDGGVVEYTFSTERLVNIRLDEWCANKNNYVIYDKLGNLTDADVPAADFGKIVYEDDFRHWELCKEGKSLKMQSMENADLSLLSFTIIVRLEYDYITKFIEVEILPGEKVKPVAVNYTSGIEVEEQLEVVTSREIRFDNKSDVDQTAYVYPYLGKPIKYYTNLLAENTDSYKGQQINLDVPAWVDGEWVQVNKKMSLGGYEPYARPDVYVKQSVTIPANTCVDVYTDVTYSMAKITGVIEYELPVSHRKHFVDFLCVTHYPISAEIRVEKRQ